jgi:hypothetical protein
MIELPKKEIWVYLPNNQALHLFFPQNYITSQDNWDSFYNKGSRLIAISEADINKKLLIYYSASSINDLFAFNDKFFNLEGYQMLYHATKEINENCFIKYMEYFNPTGEAYFELAIYSNLQDNLGSMVAAHIVKIDKIALNEDNFISHIYDNYLPFELCDLAE